MTINNSDVNGAIKNERVAYMLRSAVATVLSPAVNKNRSGTDVATTPALLLGLAENTLSKSEARLEESKQKADNLAKDIETLLPTLPLVGV